MAVKAVEGGFRANRFSGLHGWPMRLYILPLPWIPLWVVIMTLDNSYLFIFVSGLNNRRELFQDRYSFYGIRGWRRRLCYDSCYGNLGVLMTILGGLDGS